MNIYFVSFLSFFLVMPVFAVEEKKVAPVSMETSAPVQLQLSKEFCQKLTVTHKPQKNVMYQAGVDAEGKSVVPATLNAFDVPLPTKIRIPVTIQKRFILKTTSSGTTKSTGTSASTISQVTQSTGTNKTTINKKALDAFTATLPGGVNTTLGALTLAQLDTLSGIISESSTSTGTSKGTSTGTTTSSGTLTQSGTGIFEPTGTIKSPYIDEIPLGFVEYELESGEMTYNGKRFSSKEETLLRQKCLRILEN